MKIVVTTDGSLRSFSVLPHAEAFARATGSEILLLRVLDPSHDVERRRGVAAHRLAESVASQWKDELAAVLESFGVPARPTVSVMRKGERTHDAIMRAAGEAEAQMIALASKGSDAVRRALFGSVAMGVVGCSMLPVMIAGPEARRPPKTRTYRILGTSDGSDTSLRALQAIQPFLSAAEVNVALLRVYAATVGDRGDRTEMRARREHIEQLKREFPAEPKVRGIVTRLPALHSLEGEIVKVAERLRVSAIAMSTHGHSARHHLLAGSTALGVLARSQVPVILARAKPAAECC